MKALFHATIERSALAAALDMLKTPKAMIVPNRGQIAPLMCVNLVATDDKVTVSGTDLDMQMQMELPALVEGTGRIAINCDTLRKAVKAGKGGDVTLADTGGKNVRMLSDTNTAMLHAERFDPGEIPVIPAPDCKRVMLETADFVHDLNRVAPFISTEETRYYLCGAFFHVRNGEFRIVATDGHRLGHLAKPCPEDFAGNPDAIVPAAAVNWVRKNAKKFGEFCHVGWAANRFIFQAGRVRFVSKVIDGTFPDYTRVIPTHGDNRIEFDPQPVAKACRDVTAHISEKTRAVTLSAGEGGWMTVVGRDVEHGMATASIDNTLFRCSDGETTQFGATYNAKYLAELLGCFGKNRVVFETIDVNSPVLFECYDAPEFMAVIMPMRHDGTMVWSPEAIAKANRTPVEILEDELPERIENENGTPIAKRLIAKLISEAIDYTAGNNGGDRYEARQVILHQVAAMTGGLSPIRARIERAKANSFQKGNSCAAVSDADHFADAGDMRSRIVGRYSPLMVKMRGARSDMNC